MVYETNEEMNKDLTQKIDLINDLKITYNLSESYSNKVIGFLKNRFTKDFKIKYEYLIDHLPLSIKREIFIIMFEKEIQHFMIFKSLKRENNMNIIMIILNSLRSLVSFKKEVIQMQNHSVNEVFFIKNGKINIYRVLDLNKIFRYFHLDIEDIRNFIDFSSILKKDHKADLVEQIPNKNPILLEPLILNNQQINDCSKSGLFENNTKNISNLNQNNLLILNDNINTVIKENTPKKNNLFKYNLIDSIQSRDGSLLLSNKDEVLKHDSLEVLDKEQTFQQNKIHINNSIKENKEYDLFKKIESMKDKIKDIFELYDENSSKNLYKKFMNTFINPTEIKSIKSKLESSTFTISKFKKLSLIKLMKWDYFGDYLLFTEKKSPVCLEVISETTDMLSLNKQEYEKLLIDFKEEISSTVLISMKNFYQIQNILNNKIRELFYLLERQLIKIDENIFPFDLCPRIKHINSEAQGYTFNFLKNSSMINIVSNKVSSHSLISKRELSAIYKSYKKGEFKSFKDNKNLINNNEIDKMLDSDNGEDDNLNLNNQINNITSLNIENFENNENEEIEENEEYSNGSVKNDSFDENSYKLFDNNNKNLADTDNLFRKLKSFDKDQNHFFNFSESHSNTIYQSRINTEAKEEVQNEFIVNNESNFQNNELPFNFKNHNKIVEKLVNSPSNKLNNEFYLSKSNKFSFDRKTKKKGNLNGNIKLFSTNTNSKIFNKSPQKSKQNIEKITDIIKILQNTILKQISKSSIKKNNINKLFISKTLNNKSSSIFNFSERKKSIKSDRINNKNTSFNKFDFLSIEKFSIVNEHQLTIESQYENQMKNYLSLNKLQKSTFVIENLDTNNLDNKNLEILIKQNICKFDDKKVVKFQTNGLRKNSKNQKNINIENEIENEEKQKVKNFEVKIKKRLSYCLNQNQTEHLIDHDKNVIFDKELNKNIKNFSFNKIKNNAYDDFKINLVKMDESFGILNNNEGLKSIKDKDQKRNNSSINSNNNNFNRLREKRLTINLSREEFKNLNEKHEINSITKSNKISKKSYENINDSKVTDYNSFNIEIINKKIDQKAKKLNAEENIMNFLQNKV